VWFFLRVYYTVQNKDYVELSVNAGFWTEDLDASDYENPPPTYEQALKMTELTAAASTEDFEQGIAEDTRR